MWKSILKNIDDWEDDADYDPTKKNPKYMALVPPSTLKEVKDYLESIDEKSRDGPATISALKIMIDNWNDGKDIALSSAEIIRLHKEKNR
tara:strand:+ start:244 stop:513 length:270 start_codon:yes stop_codon:yes gene_type:complete